MEAIEQGDVFVPDLTSRVAASGFVLRNSRCGNSQDIADLALRESSLFADEPADDRSRECHSSSGSFDNGLNCKHDRMITRN